MTRTRKYGYGFGDLINQAMDDLAYGNSFFPSIPSYTFKGQVVDTDKYDIVPKRKYTEELIQQAQERIDALDRQHESDEKHYREQRKRLLEKKESLEMAKDNKQE